jgi:hypothetical protein
MERAFRVSSKIIFMLTPLKWQKKTPAVVATLPQKRTALKKPVLSGWLVII